MRWVNAVAATKVQQEFPPESVFVPPVADISLEAVLQALESMTSVYVIDAVPGTSKPQVGFPVDVAARKYTLRPDSPAVVRFWSVVVAPAAKRIVVEAVAAVKVPVVEAGPANITPGFVIASVPKLFNIIRLLKAEGAVEVLIVCEVVVPLI